MRSNESLRGRIVAAYVLLALTLCTLFAGVAFLTIKAIERELIDRRLSLEFERLVARKNNGARIDSPVDIQLLEGAAIPPVMRKLPSGLHEITIGGNTLHVMVGMEDGERRVLVQDQSSFEQIEIVVVIAVAVIFIASLLLALLLGRTTASRVITPLTGLAQAIAKDVKPDRLPALNATDETGVLARAFAKRTIELQQFLVRERLFTGDVSHELRTPLTVILGSAEVLLARLSDRPALETAAERIRRTALEATQRVAALLLLSRSPETIEAPRIELKPLVEREIERCRPLLTEKPVEVRLEASPGEVCVYAARELVAIAIGNLIRNACQYTEQGDVTVHILSTAIAVEDTGPGVPDALRVCLFERFTRGVSHDTAGSGLGLAIVKRAVEHLGWELRLEDRAGGGSRFSLVFSPAP